MFDFMAICNACGQKELGRTCGKGASTCEGCWSLTESPEARFCEVCANRKNCCKFCAAELQPECRPVQVAQPVPAMHPLPTATLLGKTPIPSAPAWIVDCIMTILVLAFVYAGYYFLILRF